MNYNRKLVVRAFIRFLRKEGLIEQFKQDYNFRHKISILCDNEQIRYYRDNDIDLSWINYIKLRFDENRNDVFSRMIDVSLCYRLCKYDNWSEINERWRKFYRSKIENKLQ